MSFKRKPPVGNVRRVRSTGQNIRGVITSKTDRLVQFESWAERALILRLDRDPTVLDYQSQPETFIFLDEQGKQHSYTPDFMVRRRDGTVEIHEVTMSKRRNRPELQRREQAARNICRAREWQYVIQTEHTLPQGCELANLLALAGYRPIIYAQQAVAQAVSEQLSPNVPVRFSMLTKRLHQSLGTSAISKGDPLTEGQVTGSLCHLLWHGRLMTDLDQLLFDQGHILPGVQVWIGAEEEQNDTPTT